MQANLAIGFIETSSIAKGIEASDAMCKMAEVRLHKTAAIPRGKYIILVSGLVGEVESAMRAGMEIAGQTVIHRFIIRNVHEQVLEALDRRVQVEKLEAVGIGRRLREGGRREAFGGALGGSGRQGLGHDDRRGGGGALGRGGRHPDGAGGDACQPRRHPLRPSATSAKPHEVRLRD